MSGEIDGYYDVYSEQVRVARKEHCCDACKETIRTKDRYVVAGLVFLRKAESIKRCLRCQAIHEHLRVVCKDGDGEMWPSERLDCGEEYKEHWGKAPPEDITALAFVTAEEMQARANKDSK